MGREEKKFRISVQFMGKQESFIMNEEDTNDLYREHIMIGTFDWIRIEEFI